ncbi:MAG: hypothetical protein Q4A01_09375 [Coriobacteriales bacterium]|nr:hypothetical protein [Coriobacteriales bacterium]
MLISYIKRMESSYRDFMGGVSLPQMELQTMSLEEMRAQLANAEVIYNPTTNAYTFRVFEQINHPAIAKDCEYIIFHEFTHALDISRYGAGNRDKYNQLRGYLEYHASQVELMKMLGASTFHQTIEFSLLDKVCDTNGEVTVLEFIEQGMNATSELMSKPDFKQNLNLVFHAVGTLYNYLGRISICRMYATDFDAYSSALEQKCAGEGLFGSEMWKSIRTLFNGMMTDSLIDLGGMLYYGSLLQLCRSYGIVG